MQNLKRQRVSEISQRFEDEDLSHSSNILLRHQIQLTIAMVIQHSASNPSTILAHLKYNSFAVSLLSCSLAW